MYFSPLFAARYYRQTFLKEIGQQSHLCIQLLFMLPLLGFKGTAYLLEAFPLIFQNIDNHCSFFRVGNFCNFCNIKLFLPQVLHEADLMIQSQCQTLIYVRGI